MAVDEGTVAAALQELPSACGYLEQQLGAGVLGTDALTLGDIAVAAQFVNLQYGGEQIDAAAFPRLAQFLARTLARPSFADCLADERKVMGG